MTSLSENKKAFFDYEILEKFEAGLILFGFEAKAAKSGQMHLTGSYVIIKNNIATLLNADIPAYQPKNTPIDYNSKRTRLLLLNKKEIKYLEGKQRESHLTLVPLKVYNKHGLVKLVFGLAKGKKTFDKRETIKKREAKLKIGRALRGDY
jgi:SsrA-binding protein